MQKNLLIAVFFLLAGCGSIMESVQNANTQNILIQTPRVEGAECRVSDGMGRKWNVWETPGAVAVQEGHPPLVIVCSKKGFKKSVLTINEKKEEILTIDGKRVDFSIFGDFPTKFPRLIPAAIRETAGFVQDPTGSISTEYPNTITVWMEPKAWESEEQMREWAFDREVQNRADFNSDEEFRLSEEKRKADRRAAKKARKEKLYGIVDSARKGLVKGTKNAAKIVDHLPAIKHSLGKAISNDDDENVKQKSNLRAASEAVNSKVREGFSGLNPGSAVDFLNKRNEVRDEEIEKRMEERRMEAKANEGAPVKIYSPQNQGEPQDLHENEIEPGAGGNDSVQYKYDRNGMRIR